jgi:capsular exopolysaccharide synthesis family protein
MDLRQFLAILRRRWWTLVLGLVVGAAGAYGFSKTETPVYQAQATLLLNLAQQASVPTFQDVSASQALTKTYARIITARPTLDEAAKRLGGGLTYKSLKTVAGTDVLQTELILASFQSKDPIFAATVANTVSQVFAERVREAQLGGPHIAGVTPSASDNLNTIYVVEPASVPVNPMSPRVTVNTIVGGVLGLLAAIAVVAVIEYLDDTVKEPADLEQHDLTLMGVVQRFSARRDSFLSVLDDSSRREGLLEAYQHLRTNIEFARLDTDIRSIVVTSAQPREGKTTTCVNLAIMAARAGRRVVLVDADLRRPAIHRALGLPNREGVTTALLSASQEGLPFLQTQVPNLRVLLTGPLPPNPAEVLGSERMVTLMRKLQEEADLVVYDTPPSVAVADAAILAAHADAVLLVVDAGRTRMSALATALDHVRRSRTRILGVVLNKVSRHGKGYQGYYDYSGSYASQAAAPSQNGPSPDKQPVAHS